MSENGRSCANCVFWAPRGERGGQSSGRCRAQSLAGADRHQGFWTQSGFVCGQWCALECPPAAAE